MEGLMLWVVSVEVALCLLVAVLACVCGCRKTVPKNELLGLAGMVKLTNPEESYSQNGQWPPATTSSASLAPDANANKRSSTTANRSLPDLPVDFGQMRNPDGSVIWESQEGGGDTGSELYATVEENSRPGTSNLRGKKAVPRELSSESKEESDGARDGTSPSGTPGVLEDDGFPPYARLRKEHPYDKLRKSEHPYAQVRPPSSREPDADQIPLDRLDSCDPVPPPRTRKSVSYSSLTPPPAAVSSGVAAVGSTCIGDSPNTPRSPHSPRSLHSPPGSVPDIPAATAIAGRISANQELPYMTPPISTSQGQPGQHFSGDSQDSSKGYTSISVREPLANIRSQRPHDSHYATVSDDSDEMYAAIEDPGQVYTSGSETYAQIQPLALASVAVLPAHPRTPEVVDCEDIVSTSASTVQGTQPLPSAQPQGVQSVLAPQPPSVDSLKHVAQAHSRQASSSSAASSVTNLGSPKPEKRPANSPLPPPPANLASPEGGCSLEDMYAKVVKKKRGSSEETDGRSQDTDSPRSQPSSPQRRFSTPQPTEVSTSVDPGYETVSAAELKARESVQQQHPGYETVRRNFSSDVDPNYEELQVQSGDPGYAHIPAHSDGREPEYARISRSRAGSLSNEPDVAIEPDYASISRGKKSCSGTNGTKSNEIDDPGYEQVQLKKENLAGDDSDQDNPGYERVHARSSTVRKLCTLEGDEVASDPGYEQVRLAGAIHKHNMSDQDNEGLALNQFDPNQFDPNYETVLNEEPNYESVRYYDDSGGRNDPSCKQVEAGDAASNPLLGNCKDRSNVR